MGLNYEIIEKYLNGELSPEELNDFNTQLTFDADFKQEVELYKEVNKSLVNKYTHFDKEEKLKKSLKKMGAKYFETQENIQEPNTKTIPIKTYFLRISSIAAIVILAFFLLKPQTSLYDQFAEHSKLEIQVKGDNNETLLNAAELFNDKNYIEATPLLESYLRENPEDFEVQMSLGISLLESNKNEEAILIFEHVKSEDNVFKNKAIWYLALTNLKLDNKINAKVFLEKISQESFYFKDAQKILKKL